jgi:hypothetical protein
MPAVWPGMFAWEGLHLETGTWEITAELQGVLWHGKGEYMDSRIIHVIDVKSVSHVQAQAQIRAELNSLQFPAKCRSARALLYELGWSGGGIGAMLHQAAYGLLAAWETNRTLVWSFDRTQFGVRDCPDCWLKPAAQCTRMDFEGLQTYRLRPGTEDAQVVELTPTEWLFEDRGAAESVVSRYIVPDRYRQLGKLWITSQLIAFLSTPTNFLQEKIDEIATRIKFETPCACAWVRSKWKRNFDHRDMQAHPQYAGGELTRPCADTLCFCAHSCTRSDADYLQNSKHGAWRAFQMR